jgi:hypothetical protein
VGAYSHSGGGWNELLPCKVDDIQLPVRTGYYFDFYEKCPKHLVHIENGRFKRIVSLRMKHGLCKQSHGYSFCALFGLNTCRFVFVDPKSSQSTSGFFRTSRDPRALPRPLPSCTGLAMADLPTHKRIKTKQLPL